MGFLPPEPDERPPKRRRSARASGASTDTETQQEPSGLANQTHESQADVEETAATLGPAVRELLGLPAGKYLSPEKIAELRRER